MDDLMETNKFKKNARNKSLAYEDDFSLYNY